jgi:HicA toxin of bacterial toxin-antitoxin,
VSKQEKLIQRLRSMPTDFTWDEAKSLMKARGYSYHKGSGSARWWLHTTTKHKVRLHEPHPEPFLKRYMVETLINALDEGTEANDCPP